MELGPFCYFPSLNSEAAARYRVLDTETLARLLESAQAPAAAFSGYGLAIRSPMIEPLGADEAGRLEQALARGYEEVARMEEFGQAATTLRLMKRRSP